MLNHPRFEPVVGYDIRPDSLHNFEHPVGSFKLTKEISTLLETRGINLFYVSTPPKFYALAVCGGLSSNWNILCEKPLGISLSESENLFRIIEMHDVFQGVNFVFSGAPSMQVAREELASGSIGELRGAEFIMKFAKWTRPWQAHASWLGEQEQGGMMREVGSDYAYLSHEIFGELQLGASQIIEYPGTGHAETLFMGQWKSSVGPVTVNARIGGFREDIVR